jgi:thermitase
MSIASRWPLPDRRTPQQLALDSAAVRAQVKSLTDPNADGTARQDQEIVIQRIRERSQGLGLLHFNGGDNDLFSLAVAGQLIIDADDEQLDSVSDLLTGCSTADRDGRSEHRRTRVFDCGADKSPEHLREVARKLRDDHQIMATINSVVPLGYVIKGDSYPSATVSPADFAGLGGDAPVRVAVVDTGITAVKRDDGWDTGVVRDGIDPLDELVPLGRIDWFGGHGTFATGVVRQLAPDCEVVVYRYTTADGIGSDEAAADMMIRAAEDAAGGRLVINCSFGAPAVDGVPPLALQEAVAHIHAQHPNTLIVASAGNDGGTTPLYPAAFPGVKAVAGLTSDLTPASFSNHGDWVSCSAVGVGVVSTFVEGTLPPEPLPGKADVQFGQDAWAAWSGTSFTAPQISGAVAALCGEDADLSPAEAFDRLLEGRPTQPGYGTTVHLLPGTPT